jgi:hypothetical protein
MSILNRPIPQHFTAPRIVIRDDLAGQIRKDLEGYNQHADDLSAKWKELSADLEAYQSAKRKAGTNNVPFEVAMKDGVSLKNHLVAFYSEFVAHYENWFALAETAGKAYDKLLAQTKKALDAREREIRKAMQASGVVLITDMEPVLRIEKHYLELKEQERTLLNALCACRSTTPGGRATTFFEVAKERLLEEL